jgi:hypothetical protein
MGSLDSSTDVDPPRLEGVVVGRREQEVAARVERHTVDVAAVCALAVVAQVEFERHSLKPGLTCKGLNAVAVTFSLSLCRHRHLNPTDPFPPLHPNAPPPKLWVDRV